MDNIRSQIRNELRPTHYISQNTINKENLYRDYCHKRVIECVHPFCVLLAQLTSIKTPRLKTFLCIVTTNNGSIKFMFKFLR